MNPLTFLLFYIGEAVLIVVLLLLLEWLRARRGRTHSTEIRLGVYRDDPPTDDETEDEDG